jgi:deaminated glutathione amidase
MRTALVQITAGDRLGDNLPVTLEMVRVAALTGVGFVLTPTITNCIPTSRSQRQEVLQTKNQEQTLTVLSDFSRTLGIWFLLGSLALNTESTHGPFANWSFLIAPDGLICARYDKIHMFNV